MSHTLALARHITRRTARSALDPARAGFGDAFVDDAIRWACSRFCDESSVVRATADIALSAGDPAASFSSITNFRPERILRARIINNKITITVTGSPAGGTFSLLYTDQDGVEDETTAIPYNTTGTLLADAITDSVDALGDDALTGTGGAGGPWTLTIDGAAEDEFGTLTLEDNDLTGGTSPSVAIERQAESKSDLDLLGFDDVLDYRACPGKAAAQGYCTSEPQIIGFDTQSAAQLWPAPTYASTLRVWYWAPFTSFTAGSQGAYSASVTYYEGDVVSNSSNAYLCIAKTLNNTPTDTAYWTLLGATTAVPVATPSTQTLNVPDDLLERVLHGAAGKLMEASDDAEDKALSAVLIGQFNQFINSSRGRGSVAGRS